MITFDSYASSSSGNVNIISDDHTSIMLDCGKPWKWIQKKMNFNTSSLSGICITHQHNDHSQAAKDAAKTGIDLFMLQETKDALGLTGHRIHAIEPLKQFTIGTFTIKAFPLQHDVPICGFLMANKQGERAIYITDTAYCQYKFPGLQIIAIEANYCQETLQKNIESGLVSLAQKHRLIRSHFSIENVADMLRANDLSKLKEIWLLHLSGDNSDAEHMKRIIQGITGKPVYIPDA